VRGEDQKDSEFLEEGAFDRISPSPKRFSIEFLAQLRLIIVISLLLLHLIFQFAMWRLGENPNVVFNDGVGYFSYLPSLIFDRDLDFRNEYERLTSYSSRVKEFWFRDPLPGNRPRNIYAIGPAILWAPFYLVDHALVWLSQPITGWTPDGLSFPYQLSAVLASFFFGVLGALWLEGLLRSRFPPHIAFAAAWSSVLATPVVYYMLFEPSMAHALDFFVLTVFLVYLEQYRKSAPSPWSTRLLGLFVGLLFLVRWINAIFLLWAALAVLRERPGRADSLGDVFRFMVALLAGFVVGALPQLLVWKNLFGAFFVVPGGAGYFQINLEGFWGTLFSTKNGLYVWTPIAAVGTIGLFIYRGWGRTDRFVFFVLFLTAVCVNALVHDWWGGDSFGMRRFVGFFPFLAFGVAEVLDRVQGRLPAVLFALAGMIGWNGYLMIARKLVWFPY
jgi:hypothetical protein